MPGPRLRTRSVIAAVVSGIALASALVAPSVPASALTPVPATAALAATSLPPVQAPVRINAGGPAGTFEGHAYQADTHYLGGTTSWSGDTVTGTTSSAAAIDMCAPIAPK